MEARSSPMSMQFDVKLIKQDVGVVLLAKFTRFNIENELYEISSKREPILLWSYSCSAHKNTID